MSNWLSKWGLIDRREAKRLGKISAWAEFGEYSASFSFKGRDLNELNGDMVALSSTIEIAHLRRNGCGLEEERMMNLELVMESSSGGKTYTYALDIFPFSKSYFSPMNGQQSSGARGEDLKNPKVVFLG
ncbi:unnamed protein product [Linum tenue]|uniref:Uncharacterized protein n=1 Tax=Linum tenue TaxID=586396 RepID=A0AAV0QMP0_9ROSI|nr:unnamed protein product [Linum tenue]